MPDDIVRCRRCRSTYPVAARRCPQCTSTLVIIDDQSEADDVAKITKLGGPSIASELQQEQPAELERQDQDLPVPAADDAPEQAATPRRKTRGRQAPKAPSEA